MTGIHNILFALILPLALGEPFSRQEYSLHSTEKSFSPPKHGFLKARSLKASFAEKDGSKGARNSLQPAGGDFRTSFRVKGVKSIPENSIPEEVHQGRTVKKMSLRKQPHSVGGDYMTDGGTYYYLYYDYDDEYNDIDGGDGNGIYNYGGVDDNIYYD